MVATSQTKIRKKPTVLRLPPRGFLSRNQAQDLAGVSHVTLMEWERKGFLHPIIGRSRTSNHECFYYDPTELAECPSIRKEKYALPPGEIAGRVFELLREGDSIADIVIKLRLEPGAIEDLRQQWLESVSAKALVVADRDRVELERLLASEVRNSNDLVTRVRLALHDKPLDLTLLSDVED